MTRILALALLLSLSGCDLFPEYREAVEGCMATNGCQNRR